jgi:MFS transporter, MHS family, proline/betaine transporter
VEGDYHPVGGILLGIYAGRRGRQAALLIVIALMTVAIAMIAFAPTYAMIGVGAPLIIVIARLLQGFSAGGEFAGATAFLTESAPGDKPGAEALSRLARAFFYAGARALLVSHWAVESNTAMRLEEPRPMSRSHLTAL